jgi:acetyl esterase/lipase
MITGRATRTPAQLTRRGLALSQPLISRLLQARRCSIPSSPHTFLARTTNLTMASIWSKQPFKALYFCSVILATPPVLILLVIRYTFRALRPVPEWGLRGSVMLHVLRGIIRTVGAMRYKTPTLNSPGKKGSFVRIAPADSAVYAPLPSNPAVKPAPINGLWFPEPYANSAEETVVLHMPAGAFVMAFPAELIAAHLAETVDRIFGARLLYAQYRLAHDETRRFPAALLDAVSAYAHLLAAGVPPHNIILSGDSAGGNLVLALVRLLSSGKSTLPRPRGAIAWSPWVDLSVDGVESLARHENRATDVLHMHLLRWGVEAYSLRDAMAAPWVSPASSPFQTRVPLAIHAGGAELFRDQIRGFAEKMLPTNDGMVLFRESKGIPHDMVMVDKEYECQDETNVFPTEVKALFAHMKETK